MAAESPDKASHLVVVGSSAGGIEALSTVLGSIPSGFPAAIVLAQHLDPGRPSYLSSILVRKTALPVVLVEKQTPLENGKVYLVPANQHVVIEDGQVNMEGDHGNRPRPSVDLLLSSASKSYGERLIAVILTGSGSDGAAGAVDVKTAGGTVVIQNPATAAHPSMPMALPPTVVDHIAELEGIGTLLQDLVADKTPSEREAADRKQVMPELLDLVSRHAAIDFQSYKASTILRRLARRMAVTQSASLRDYLEHVKGHRDELSELARSFLIKVTEFFRDPEAFEYLKTDILPRVFAAGRDRGRVLRMWSAGCATGEEAYSLAMSVTDALGPDLSHWNVRIFATDVNESAINFARRGLYPANVLRNVAEQYREQFFERSGPGYRVKKAIRQLVIFGQQDLARGAPFPRIDLVVCRNLLIYFQPELQQDLLDLFAYALHQTSGYLFLGKAETARPSRGSFDLVNKKWKVYRCLAGPAGTDHARGMALAAPERARRTGDGAAGPEAAMDLVQLRRLNEHVLRHLPTGVVLVDRGYRILSINAPARRLLGVREAVNEQDFLHTVRSLPYAEVRDAIDRVFREKTNHVATDLELEGSGGLNARVVSLHLAPVHGEGPSPDAVVVSIQDTTELADVQRRLNILQNEHRQLVDELRAANERMKHTNEQLQEANEELQGANEELLLAQEELQATNEEFEATNEELQATNEELETNNEELQATNEELEATNEELTARTSELQEATNLIVADRVRLSQLLDVTPYPVAFLRGPTLAVAAMNTKADGHLVVKEDLGRPFAELASSPEHRQLADGARRAFDANQEWVSPPLRLASGGEGAPAPQVFHAVPTHDPDGRVVGIVIYGRLADVTSGGRPSV
jgi:two-component system CheB/CheR fusion protein